MLLHYSEIGNGNPVIVLHGLYGSGDNWFSVARVLSGWYRLYLVDLRNHGRSFHAPGMSYPEMANDLNLLLNEIGLERVSIIGHSMGGKVAIQFANLWPGRVEKLVIVDISPFNECAGSVTFRAHEQIVRGLLSMPLSQIVTREQANELLSGYVGEERVRHFLLKNLKREGDSFRWQLNVEAIRNNMAAIMAGVMPSEGEFRFNLKTLFIRGEYSGYISEACAALIQQSFTNYEIVTISNAGHWVHAEQQLEFIKVVTEFLGQ